MKRNMMNFIEDSIKEKKEKDERNYGIDLLRIISMFFIVILHCLGQGGILKNTVLNSIQYKFAWFIEICAYSAVDIFALISGYVCYSDKDKKVKFSNYINIWLQVFFWGIVVTVGFNFFYPSIISKKDYLIALFPVTNGLYWYFSAYTGLFAIMPFLNNGIRNCSESTMKKLFIVILLVFSVFDTISNRFCLSGGYSFIWLVLLYLLGATIKKCKFGKKLKVYHIWISVSVLYIVTYFYKIYGFEITKLNIKITKDILVSYTSPTILGVAILYVIGFSKIKLSPILKKIVKFAAPSSFAIYLLNNHRLVWEYVMKNRFVNVSNQSLIKIFVAIIGFSVIFVIISIFIDKIRILIFKICNIKSFTRKVEDIVNITMKKFLNRS